MSERTTDHVYIDALRVTCIIGVLDHERTTPQPIQIDADIEIDLAEAGRTDDLTKTVHYGEVAVALADLARTTGYQLLERLAEHMAEVVLAFPRVEAVELTVTKLEPPIPEDIGATAVRIRRENRIGRGSHRAVIALGTNLGDRVANLRFAVGRLGNAVVATSQVFETDPVGGPENQGAYLNMAVVVETSLDPYALLRQLNRIEAEAGRERLVHWGPRTLDLDVIFYDDIVISDQHLTIPHPRYAERRFVLAPLHEIDPTRCPIGWESSLPPDAVHPRGPLALL